MPTFIKFVVMNQLWKSSLRPTARALIKLIGESTHSHRNGHALWREKRELVFPVQTSRRNRGARQPIERDVIKDIIARESFSLSIENARDEFVTTQVMVKYPCRQSDGRIFKRIKRLRRFISCA